MFCIKRIVMSILPVLLIATIIYLSIYDSVQESKKSLETPVLLKKIKNNNKTKICRPDCVTFCYCNHCRCADDGTEYLCTKKNCDNVIWNENGTLKTNPSEILPGFKQIFCDPESVVNVYCNQCKCSMDGTEYTCTQYRCKEGKWRLDGSKVGEPPVESKKQQTFSEAWLEIRTQGEECMFYLLIVAAVFGMYLLIEAVVNYDVGTELVPNAGTYQVATERAGGTSSTPMNSNRTSEYGAVPRSQRPPRTSSLLESGSAINLEQIPLLHRTSYPHQQNPPPPPPKGRSLDSKDDVYLVDGLEGAVGPAPSPMMCRSIPPEDWGVVSPIIESDDDENEFYDATSLTIEKDTPV